jgi:hypothetical protein
MAGADGFHPNFPDDDARTPAAPRGEPRPRHARRDGDRAQQPGGDRRQSSCTVSALRRQPIHTMSVSPAPKSIDTEDGHAAAPFSDVAVVNVRRWRRSGWSHRDRPAPAAELNGGVDDWGSTGRRLTRATLVSTAARHRTTVRPLTPRYSPVVARARGRRHGRGCERRLSNGLDPSPLSRARRLCAIRYGLLCVHPLLRRVQ